MPKYLLLVLLGVLALLVGGVLFGQGDNWSRALGEVFLHAGVVFLAAGLGVWSIVDAIQRRPDGL